MDVAHKYHNWNAVHTNTRCFVSVPLRFTKHKGVCQQFVHTRVYTIVRSSARTLLTTENSISSGIFVSISTNS
jgi:hypothetical protein